MNEQAIENDQWDHSRFFEGLRYKLVLIELSAGIEVHAKLMAWDAYGLLLQNDSETFLLSKSAILSVRPGRDQKIPAHYMRT